MKGITTSDAVLAYTIGHTAMPTDLTRTMRLWQVLPAADGTGGVEMSGLGYARHTVVTGDFGTQAAGQVSSLQQIDFGTSTGGGPFLEGISIHNTAGDFIRIMAFPDRKFWDSIDGLKIPAGGILLEEQ